MIFLLLGLYFLNVLEDVKFFSFKNMLKNFRIIFTLLEDFISILIICLSMVLLIILFGDKELYLFKMNIFDKISVNRENNNINFIEYLN